MTAYNVGSLLRGQAEARPDAVGLRFPSSGYTTAVPTWDSWTYGELDGHSDAYARGFLEAGVCTGDRALVLVKPSLEFYAMLYGLFKIGAIPVLLDPGMGMGKLLECIERTQPRVCLAMSLVHAVRMVKRRAFASVEVPITVGSRWFWGGTTAARCHVPADTPFEIVPRGATDDAAIIFTSGSTGTAKGVASTQAMFAAQVKALGKMFGFAPGMQDMQAFAAFAIFDLSLGMTSVIPKMDLSKPATALPEDLMACVRTHTPEVAFGSPVVWQNLSRWCTANDATLDGLRTLLTVGAPIPAYLLRRLTEQLPEGSQAWTPYGATEAMPVSWIGSTEILTETWSQTAQGHGTCVGTLAPGLAVRIIPIDDAPIPRMSQTAELPAGEVGEIVVSGDQVSPEYKDVPQANASAKVIDDDGVCWHRMGDLGSLDAQGRLWFHGRLAHRLETTAGMVPAVPVEGVFNEHELVFRSALVGLGPRGQERPVLCVELEPGAVFTPQLERQLVELQKDTRWEGVVQHYVVHPGFPTDARHNSKIRREDLKAWAESRVAPALAEAA